MKGISRQFDYLLGHKRVRRNVQALARYLAFLGVVVVTYAVLFHLIMYYVEGRVYPWITGLYWTLVTMSTLGYGEITFQSVGGQLFSIVVLLSGIVLLLVVLPFTFIRFLYAPWLEAQIRMRIPRRVPEDAEGHVVICSYDGVTQRLLPRLEQAGLVAYVLEDDPETASERYFEGVPVVTGEVDSKDTYTALGAERARMILVNRTDAVNTNITLTIREVAPEVPVVAIADDANAVGVLERSGATHVLPLKQWLGEQLANRVNASHAQAHVIGRYEDLLIAELPVHHTPLVGKGIRETNLRNHTGLSIVGVWERGRLNPPWPEHKLTQSSVLVVVGTEAQLDELDFLFAIYDVNPNPVLIIGGGGVGAAAARALMRKEIPVHLVERDPARGDRLRTICKQVFVGDAADPALLVQAGVKEAPTVLLATSDDAMNIYLSSHCRELNPELRIIGRIRHERNIEAIHQAGADFVMGSASLGIEAVLSILAGKQLILLGEDVELFSVALPDALKGRTLAQSDIGARTALTVVAIRQNGQFVTGPSASTRLYPGAELLMIGNVQQRQAFAEAFGG